MSVPASRRVLALVTSLMATSSFGVLLVISSPQASACNPSQVGSCVGVSVGVPGSPGAGQSPAGGGVVAPAGPVVVDPCAAYPGPLHQFCVTSTGVGCLGLFDKNSATVSFEALNALLSSNGCPTLTAGSIAPSPATLAQQAAASFQLPAPAGHRSPPETDDYQGFPMTWVNLWTFFWTDPATWKPLTATAQVGGVWATVTATPTALGFDPGDGSDPVSCAGPGRPWLKADGNNAPNQGACGFQYRKVSGPGMSNPYTSTQTITWQLTWTGSSNTSGTLTQRSTSVSGQLNVLQIQSVVVTR